ncbi:MAG: hypothetical protein OXF99_05670 [bacterium]|nr:hypothetical protein [bacterium]
MRHSSAQQKRSASKTNGRGVDVGSENVQGMDELIDRAGESLSCELSAWLADAEGRELASERLGEVISDWEAEHGEITAEELEAARAQLFGWRSSYWTPVS